LPFQNGQSPPGLGAFEPGSFLRVDIGPGTFSMILSAYDPDTTVAPFDFVN